MMRQREGVDMARRCDRKGRFDERDDSDISEMQWAVATCTHRKSVVVERKEHADEPDELAVVSSWLTPPVPTPVESLMTTTSLVPDGSDRPLHQLVTEGDLGVQLTVQA